jgi:hypothetical protein
MLKGKDTVILETIQLISRAGQLQYIPSVNGQNHNKPVVFTATDISMDRLVFENQEHDFPQRISYMRLGDDSILAVISGIRNGKERKQEFPLKRVR